jgi:hypothetical protein
LLFTEIVSINIQKCFWKEEKFGNELSNVRNLFSRALEGILKGEEETISYVEVAGLKDLGGSGERFNADQELVDDGWGGVVRAEVEGGSVWVGGLHALVALFVDVYAILAA